MLEEEDMWRKASYILQNSVARSMLAINIAETSLIMTHSDCFDAQTGLMCVSKHCSMKHEEKTKRKKATVASEQS